MSGYFSRDIYRSVADLSAKKAKKAKLCIDCPAVTSNHQAKRCLDCAEKARKEAAFRSMVKKITGKPV
jgi:hypothetical protein